MGASKRTDVSRLSDRSINVLNGEATTDFGLRGYSRYAHQGHSSHIVPSNVLSAILDLSTTSCWSLNLNFHSFMARGLALCNGTALRPCSGHGLLLIVAAAAVVEVADVGAVEDGFPLAFVNQIVHEARPCRSAGPRGCLWGVFLENRLKVLGAFAARVQAGEEEEVVLERVLLIVRRLVREPGHRVV